MAKAKTVGARKKKAAKAEVEVFDLPDEEPVEKWTDEELAVMQKYSHMDGRVIAGSMRSEGKKKVFKFLCPRCPQVREIATSDAFQVWLCRVCTVEARKANRKKAKPD